MAPDDPLERYENTEVELRLTNGEHVFGVLDAYTEDFIVLTGEGEPENSPIGDTKRNYIDGERSFNSEHVVSIEPMNAA